MFDIYPKNETFFKELITFLKEILCLLYKNNISITLYGSLAYLFYTGDKNVEINDIDLLVNDKDIDNIANILKGVGDINIEKTDYHTLKIIKGKLKISFDSKEFYNKGLSEESVKANIFGINISIVSHESLIEMYSRGAETIIPKREQYLRKKKNLINVSF